MAQETKTVTRRHCTYEELLLEKYLRDRNYVCYWRTREGKKIPLKSLSDEHLERIINFINKNREAAEHLEDCDILDKDRS